MKTRALVTLALMLAAVACTAQETQALTQASMPAPAEGLRPAWGWLQGYAGPGWNVRFAGDEPGMDSLAPVMLRVTRSLFLGTTIAYSESSAEAPSRFLGGLRAEWYPTRLARAWYATSVGMTVSGGVSGASGGTAPTEIVPIASITADVSANATLFPELTIAAGPSVTLDVTDEGASLSPGITFGLREGTAARDRAIVPLPDGSLKVGGYWQGLFAFLDGRPYFVDGGGTRVVLPSGFALGITGGVLRMRFAGVPGDLAVMQTGLAAEWNVEPLSWLTIATRLTTGLAMYGWILADGPQAGSLQGGPTLMLRPELTAFVRVLPFLRVGGGAGYHLAIGNPTSDLDTARLSSVVFTIQVRAGM